QALVRRLARLRRTIRCPRKLHLEWTGRVEMKVTLREGDDDAILRKGPGDHLAQIAADLCRVGLDDVNPVSQLEGEGAVAKVREEGLWFGFFLYHSVPLSRPTVQLEHAPGIRTVGSAHGD